ncbi:hypothetical protein RGUI_0828 [Rhodovulum sp. P5]|uniref:hypothetical protein n=1 Tax=Rhodovulum phage vB_RhkS_P1 TaxID=1873452 RepID=UPI00080AA94D|nr:hypothetical protein [Rhodovulum sp. P5]YP_009285914.1 hypothetical protein BI026_gp29 [Rhodovulum phage vB_RhkS_P1]ANT39900.1 hypothetical protein Rhks_29 [Rhodovulum phage vB_RhkS_P1]ARE38969.1 hypothetical protein RGUI_0828 [Rhodovulum sp. P5]
MAWRWKNAKGETGYAHATQAEAIDDALKKALKRDVMDMQATERDRLWAGLVRGGWRLTEE